MRKICYIAMGLPFDNGIGTFVTNVLTGMDKTKWEIHLIMTLDSNGEKQSVEHILEEQNIKIYRTNDLRNSTDIFHHCKKLFKLLKQIRPDVVHSNMSFLDGANCLVALLAGVPVRVCHAHNSKSKDTKKPTTSKIYHSLMRAMCKIFSNRFCGCSDEAIDYYYGHKYLEKHKAVVIHNAVDCKRFANVDRSACIKKFGYDSFTYRIATVGGLIEQKNPFFIIDIMNELYSVRKDVQLLWVGDGYLRNQIEEKIMDGVYPICMLGVRRDVNEVMACCDAFIMPSLFEGLPVAIVEAQAAGLPCVASTGVPEQANCGKVIRLPLEDGAKVFAQTISDILDGKITMEIDEEKMSKFDIPYMIEQLEKVYES